MILRFKKNEAIIKRGHLSVSKPTEKETKNPKGSGSGGCGQEEDTQGAHG